MLHQRTPQITQMVIIIAPIKNRATKESPQPVSKPLVISQASVESRSRAYSSRNSKVGAAIIPPRGGKAKVPSRPAKRAPPIEIQLAPAWRAFPPIKKLSIRVPAIANKLIITKPQISRVANPVKKPWRRTAAQMITTPGKIGTTIPNSPTAMIKYMSIFSERLSQFGIRFC